MILLFYLFIYILFVNLFSFVYKDWKESWKHDLHIGVIIFDENLSRSQSKLKSLK